MRRLALLAALLAVPLALPAAAAAKRLRSVTACGADACVTSHDRALLAAFTDVGPPSDPPSRPAPFYRVTMRIAGSAHAAASSWAPAAGRLLGEDGTWMAVRAPVARRLGALTAGLAPRPAAQLPGFPAARSTPRERGGLSPTPFVAAAVAAGVLLLLLALRRRRARRPARGRSAEAAAAASAGTSSSRPAAS